MNITNQIVTKIQSSSLNHEPFNHIVIDNVLSIEIAEKLASEFYNYENSNYHEYKNNIEDKKTINTWNLFSPTTYVYFQAICSIEICQILSKKFNISLLPDYGLHGGGQHIHSTNGNLNPHLDYSIHPKLNLERRLNVIYYLTDSFESCDGGSLGFWSNDIDKPYKLVKEYEPLFNRMIVFDTSENSWHGLTSQYQPSKKKYRKSLASYYLSEQRDNCKSRTRALFAPRDFQSNNQDILNEIKARSSEVECSKVYRTKK